MGDSLHLLLLSSETPPISLHPHSVRENLSQCFSFITRDFFFPFFWCCCFWLAAASSQDAVPVSVILWPSELCAVAVAP